MLGQAEDAVVAVPGKRPYNLHGVNAGGHEAQERTQAPLQTNLISYSSHAEAPKEWFYYPEVTQPPASPTEGPFPISSLILLSN